MTKKQFCKLEEEDGFHCAIWELQFEEKNISKLDDLLEVVAEDIADWVATGDFDKAKRMIQHIEDNEGAEYWYYDYKDRGLPKPIDCYEDIEFLLTDD